jgi:uncharacterized protein YjhX (UPF0386 family)
MNNKNSYLCLCGQENDININNNKWSYNEIVDEEVYTCNYCKRKTTAIIITKECHTNITINKGELIDRNNTSSYILLKSYLISKSSADELLDMITQISDDGSSSLNKLLFTQSISIMESYFYNTLKALILNNEKIFMEFIRTSKNLSQEKHTIYEYLMSPLMPRDKVMQRLNEIIYHNLNIVFSIYKNTCGIKINIDNHDLKTLTEAIQFRHDCSHRNGYTNKGIKLDIFKPLYIKRITLIIQKLIYNINDEIKNIELSNDSVRKVLDNYLDFYNEELNKNIIY